MGIKPIGLSTNTKQNENNCASHSGTCFGLGAGLFLSGGLVYSQLNNLKTVRGKKYLLEGLSEQEKGLRYERTVLRDEFGKPTLPKSGITSRTKKIVSNYKKELFGWGIAILGITTGLGILADKSISKVNEKVMQNQTK